MSTLYTVYITESGQMRPIVGITVVGFNTARKVARREADELEVSGFKVEYHGEPFAGDWCMYDCTKGDTQRQIRIERA